MTKAVQVKSKDVKEKSTKKEKTVEENLKEMAGGAGPASSNTTTSPSIPDAKAVKRATKKFDAQQKKNNEASYSLSLDSEQTDFLKNTFYNRKKWTGAEAYAVLKTYEAIFDSHKKETPLKCELSAEIVEAVFHLVKNFEGAGVQESRMFVSVADKLAETMQNLNQDRQDLNDLAVELEAAKHGISPEEFVQMYAKQQNQNGAPQA